MSCFRRSVPCPSLTPLLCRHCLQASCCPGLHCTEVLYSMHCFIICQFLVRIVLISAFLQSVCWEAICFDRSGCHYPFYCWRIFHHVTISNQFAHFPVDRRVGHSVTRVVTNSAAVSTCAQVPCGHREGFSRVHALGRQEWNRWVLRCTLSLTLLLTNCSPR